MDGLSTARLDSILWARGRSSTLLVSQGILHSLLLHEREELSFSQLGCLWPEYFNWALNFETVRQGKKFNLQLPHPNDTYETAGGDSKVTFEGKTFNCAFRRNYNHHCTLHGTPWCVQHHMLCICSKHVFGPALREMGRTDTSAWILLELVAEAPRCLVLLKVSCFWAHAGVKLEAAWSKPRVIQCWVFGGVGFQDLSCGLRQYLGISGFRS